MAPRIAGQPDVLPKMFIPLHHDFVTEYGSGDDYRVPLREELDRQGARPHFRWLSDPHDYVRPELITFSWNDRYWKSRARSHCT